MSDRDPPWDDAPCLPDTAPPMPERFKRVSKSILPPGEQVAAGQIIDHECRYCGHKECFVSPGKRPHAAGLTCNGCGRHLRWFGRAEVIA